MINLFNIRPKGFNVGNDVIFQGMQQFLHHAFKRYINIVTLPATSRYESQAQAGFTARTIYEMNQYGHGVILGGGNIYENGELEINLNALEKLQIPMMVFSVSRGRVYNRLHELVPRTDTTPDNVLKAVNGKTRHVYVRDQATTDYLHQLGLAHVKTIGCPTIFINDIAHRLPKVYKPDQATVLLSVRNPSLMSIPLHKQAQVRKDIYDIIAFLHDNGRNDIHMLCHDHRDIAFAATFPDIDFIYTGDVYTYLALLSHAKLNITYRLHSFLPCLSFSVPTIAISYDERAISLIDTVGYDSWNINMVENDNVMDLVEDRYQRLDELKTMKEQNAPLWQTLRENMTQAFDEFAQDVLDYAMRIK